ncbi:MAG: S8 family serine peptidase [bacterium]
MRSFTGMRMFFVAAAIVASVTASSAIAGEMDLVSRAILRNISGGQPSTWAKASESVGGTIMVPCIVSTRDAAATVKAAEDAGGSAQPIYGFSANAQAILTAHLPIDAVQPIASREEVVALEAAIPLSRKMDTARTASNVVSVQDGTALGVPYDGTNVVVGVVDDALDYGNPDFQREGGTRVQYLNQTTGATVTECTHTAISDASCAIQDSGQGAIHGTHVTGIAAGSDSTFTGVAPAADIMFVFNAAQDADSGGGLATAVLDGVSAIFSKADIIDKPAVVNLSLGTSIGAHDGTSLLEQGLSDLSATKGGRIIVNAAGNEQVITAAFPASMQPFVGGIHAQIASPVGESWGWRFAVWDSRGSAASFTGGTLVDVWLDAGTKDSCSVALFGYTQGRDAKDFTFSGLASTDNATLVSGDVAFATDTAAPVTATDGNVNAAIEVAAADPRNGKPHATILLSPISPSSSQLQKLWYDVVIRSTGGAACSGNMWLYFDYVFYHDFLKGVTGRDVADGPVSAQKGYKLGNGDSEYTMTIPATARGVIAVGSFMPPKPVGATVSQWTGDDGVTYQQSDIAAPGGTGSVTNDLSSFSSLGPTADGRIKPEIVAPGEPIISTKARDAAVSSSITVGETHFKNEGTSMSSPHIAGIVALLLQRNNTLTVDQVKSAIAVGAHTDGMTAKTPVAANSYGAGKVDAAAALGSVSINTSLYNGTGDLDGEQPKSSSCSLIMAGRQTGSAVSALLLGLGALAIAMRRRAR